MQPLSYQSAETTCWITCMLNGIRLASGRDRVPTQVYKKFLSILKNEGVNYYNNQGENCLNEVLEFTSIQTNLNIYSIEGEQVVNFIENLCLDKQVVICDVGNGDHSILLHKRKGNWFFGFDPWWYDEERGGHRLLKFPKNEKNINVSIHREHLFSINVNHNRYTIGLEYHMGEVQSHFATVIERLR